MTTYLNAPVPAPPTSGGVGSSMDDASKAIMSTFGPSPVLNELLARAAGRAEHITSSTLAQAVSMYGNFSKTQTAKLTGLINQQTGWHTVFAPLQATTQLQINFMYQTANKYALDRVPEGVAPRFVSSRTEGKWVTLAHYSLGAEFHHEFYKTPQGREEALQRQYIVLTAAIITCKLVVAAAIVNTGAFWRKFLMRSGVRYNTVAEAQAGEVQRFGAFNKDGRAIYKLVQYVDDLVQRYAASGKGDNTALTNYVVGQGLLNQITVSSKHETEVSRRSADVTKEMLSLGARALVSVLPGRDIYEDPSWALDNVPAEELHVLRRTAIIGQYYMIDGSRATGATNGVSIQDELSIKVPDADVDDHVRYGIEDALHHNMRFTSTGEKSPRIDDFIAELPRVLNDLSLKLVDYRAVDPYVWRVARAIDMLGNANVSSNDYRSIQFWGDMEQVFWTKDQMLGHGRAAAAAIRQVAQVSSEFAHGIRDFIELADDLYNVPSTMSDADKNALMSYVIAFVLQNVKDFKTKFELDVNAHGGVKLPRIHTFQVKKGATTGIVTTFGTDAQIVLVYKYDTDTKVIVKDFKPAYDEADNVSVAAFDTSTTAVQFGNVGKHMLRPWGFASLNHFRTLAELVSNSDYTEYDQTYFKRAQSVVRVMDQYIGYLARVYPHSEIRSPFYVPSYAASGTNNADFDSIHSVACNIIDHVRHPIWISYKEFSAHADASSVKPAPPFVAPPFVASTSKLGVYLQKAIADMKFTEYNALLKSLGNTILDLIASKETGVAPINAHLLGNAADITALTSPISDAKSNSSEATKAKAAGEAVANVIAGLIEVIASTYGHTDKLKFLERLTQGDFNELITKWNEHASLGAAVATSYANEMPTSGNYFGDLLIHLSAKWLEALKASGFKRNTQTQPAELHLSSALVMSINYIASLQNGHTIVSKLTRNVIETAANGKTIAATLNVAETRVDEGVVSRKRAYEDQVQVALDASIYLNTRLLFSRDLFQVGVNAKMLTLIRPEHPDVEAPMGFFPTSTLTADQQRERFFQHSRAHPSRQGLVGTVLSKPHLSLMASVSQASAAADGTNNNKRARYDSTGFYGSLTNTSSMPLDVVAGSGFDSRGPRYISSTVRNNPIGPFYSADSSAAQNVFQTVHERVNLITRLNEIANDAPDEESRIAGSLAVLSAVHRHTLTTWLGYNLPIPDSCVVIAQPTIRLETEGMIAFAANGGTLLYAHEDISNQLNNESKQWLLNYTIWLGCAIPDESKVMVLHDVRIIGYTGGLDLSIYDNPDEFDPQRIRYNKSTFVFSCGSNFSRETALKVANPMSLFGRFFANQFPDAFKNEQRVFSNTPQWPSALFYGYLWKFHAINRFDESTITTYASLFKNDDITGLMYLGRHLAYSPTTRDHSVVIRGTGHLGNIEPPFSNVFANGITFDSVKA